MFSNKNRAFQSAEAFLFCFSALPVYFAAYKSIDCKRFMSTSHLVPASTLCLRSSARLRMTSSLTLHFKNQTLCVQVYFCNLEVPHGLTKALKVISHLKSNWCLAMTLKPRYFLSGLFFLSGRRHFSSLLYCPR